MNVFALTAVPFGVVTAIVPLVAEAGTAAVICVAEFNVNEAAEPLKATAVAPSKWSPRITTLVPVGPFVGEKLVMAGAPEIVKPTVTSRRAGVTSGSEVDSSARYCR